MLIHLDGPSGVGKTTIARRYAEEHPGVLACDIDRLRTMVGGWQHDFVGAGELVRPVALAMIGAHLRGGHDVIVPQMLLHDAERDALRAVAADGGHTYLPLVLTAPPGHARARFEGRGREDPLDAVHVEVGGDAEAAYRAVLGAVEAARAR
ncbi:MAG: AAA family ATPase [Marmoricola sp.]